MTFDVRVPWEPVRLFVREWIRLSERNKRGAASEKEYQEIGLRRRPRDESFERFDSLVGKKYERVSFIQRKGNTGSLEPCWWVNLHAQREGLI